MKNKQISNKEPNTLPTSKITKAFLFLMIACGSVFVLANLITLFAPAFILASAVAMPAAIATAVSIFGVVTSYVANSYGKPNKMNGENYKVQVPTVEKNVIEAQVIPPKSKNNNNEHTMGQ